MVQGGRPHGHAIQIDSSRNDDAFAATTVSAGAITGVGHHDLLPEEVAPIVSVGDG